MKHLKSIQFVSLMILSITTCQISNSQATISIQDFDVLNNTSWEGTLTYLDYQDNQLVPVSTTMQIKLLDDTIEQNVQYTWEPNKNVLAQTKIEKEGTYLGQQKVLSKTIREDGMVVLITTAEGTDDNKEATLYFTYEFNDHYYMVKKEVQFKGTNERFMRNQYIYKKI